MLNLTAVTTCIDSIYFSHLTTLPRISEDAIADHGMTILSIFAICKNPSFLLEMHTRALEVQTMKSIDTAPAEAAELIEIS